MTLCVDAGNTRTTFALLERGIMTASVHEMSRHLTYRKALQAIRGIRSKVASESMSAGIASVVPFLTPVIANAVKEALDCDAVVIDAATAPVATAYADPATIGADRICNVAAAYSLTKGPVIVVDCGTAVTIDCVSESGEFLGGAILNGYRTALHALARAAAQLPDVQFTAPAKALGGSTEECIRSGVILGTTFAVDGIVHRIGVEAYSTSAPMVIVTGGHGQLFSATTSLSVRNEPDLVLQGIEILTNMIRETAQKAR